MAAAAAGGERGGRGLRLTRGALSREARRRRGQAGDRGAAGRRLPATCRTMGSAEDAVKEKLLWNVKKEVRSGGTDSGGSRPPRAAPGAEGVPVPTPAAASPPSRGGGGGGRPGGGGVRGGPGLTPLSAPGAAPSPRVKQAPWGLFASRASRSPPCDGSSAGGPRSGEGWRRLQENPSCPFIAGAARGRGRGPPGSPRACGDCEPEGGLGGFAPWCPTPPSGIPLASESWLAEGSPHTSLPLPPRPPPYPGTRVFLRMVFKTSIVFPLLREILQKQKMFLSTNPLYLDPA